MPAVPPTTDPALIGSAQPDGATMFIREMARLLTERRPRILEVGTLRSDPAFPTHHQAWAPEAAWWMVDRETGPDVDEVADAHTLAADLGLDRRRSANLFDGYVACSVFEHLARPWVAMGAAADVVRPGGWLYVQTHQTFPLHGYPNDYFRFSTAALEVLATDAGLTVRHSAYTYPCQILPGREVTRWNTAASAFLNVELVAQKPEAP